MLTKGTITRDEWNNLLHLFNIGHFSSTCCNKSLISSSKTMTKRMQEQKGEEKILSKSRPAVMNISSYLMTSSSSAGSSPMASKSPGMPIASGKPDSRISVNQAHSTQRRRLKWDSRMHALAGWWKISGETRRIKKKFQNTQTILVLEPGTTKRNLLLREKKAWEKHLAQGASSSVDQKSQKNTDRRTHRITWKPSSPWSERPVENNQAILWIQKMMGKLLCEPENITSKVIFMSMFNDIAWDAKGNDELRVNN